MLLSLLLLLVVVLMDTNQKDVTRKKVFYVLVFCFSISSFVRLFCLLVFLEGGRLSYSFHVIFPWFVKASALNE